MKVCRMALAVALAGVLPLAQGETVAPASPPPVPAECWVEHTQVQPSPARQVSADAPVLATVYGALKDQRLGAEHPTEAQKKPCALKAPRPGPESGDSGATLPRSLTP